MKGNFDLEQVHILSTNVPQQVRACLPNAPASQPKYSSCNLGCAFYCLQTNGVDCGIFVCMFMERLVCRGNGLKGLLGEIGSNTNQYVSEYRQTMKKRLLNYLR